MSAIGVTVSAPGMVEVDVTSPPQAARVNKMNVGTRIIQHQALGLLTEQKLTGASPRSMMYGRMLSQGTV